MGQCLKAAFKGVLRAHARSLTSLWVLSAGSLVMGLTAREAGACSTALPPPALVGSPANGDVDVPTDVVPYYSRSAALLEQGIEFDIALSLVSTDGDVVTVSVESKYGDAFELVPERPLEPNTEYTLSTTLTTGYDGTGESVDEQLTFTTGEGPFDGTLELPDAFLIHYHFAAPTASSCSPWKSGTCVALTPQYAVVATAIDEFGQEHWPEIRDASYFINLSGVDQGTHFICERLQSRAPNGTLSEPVQICAEDGPLYALGPDEDIACTSEGLTQGGVVVTESTNVEPPDGGGVDGGDAEQPPRDEPDAGAPSEAAPKGDDPAAASSDDETNSASCSLAPSGPRSASLGWLVAVLLPITWVARATRRRRLLAIEGER